MIISILFLIFEVYSGSIFNLPPGWISRFGKTFDNLRSWIKHTIKLNALGAKEFRKNPKIQSTLFRRTAVPCRLRKKNAMPVCSGYVCLLPCILFFSLASNSLYGNCADQAFDFYWQTPEVWFQWRRSHWWSFLKIKSWNSRAIDQQIHGNQLKLFFHGVDEIRRD